MSSINELKSRVSSKLGFARPNQFLIELPFFGNLFAFAGNELLGGNSGLIPSIPGVFNTGPAVPKDMNILCTRVNMPGKQILTQERNIGQYREKMAYGFAQDDVSMSFYLLNDYGAKRYFDAWRSRILNEETSEVAYKRDYAANSVKIHQLRKPIGRLRRDVGPISINLEAGAGTVYSIELIEAFPTTINTIDFSNELDGLLELTVQLSYTRWQEIKPSQKFLNIDLDINVGSIV